MVSTKFWFIVLECLCLIINLVESDGVESAFSDSIAPITVTPEMHLHNHLFPEPDGARSFPQFGKVVDVNFTIKLLAVVDIEIQNEAIVINANIIQRWNNPSITWNPDHYGDVKNINVRPEKTWTPDIYVYANIEDDKKYNGLLSTFNTQVIVSHNGDHAWLGTITMRMSCTMNTQDYPFDRQVCPLQFGSFTYDSSRINLIPVAVNTDEYGESPEWHYISMNHTTLMNHRPGSSIPFKDAIYTIVMKRKPLYPLSNIVFPNLILALLTILAYAVPIDSGERVMYIFTIFLAITWYMTSNIDTMPNNGQTIPLITYFLGIGIVSLALLSICLCYTITCHYADANIVSIPKWIRFYILEQFGRFFGIDVDRKRSAWREKLHEVRKLDKYLVSNEDIFEEQKEQLQQPQQNEEEDGMLMEPPVNLFNSNELSLQNNDESDSMNQKLGSLWTGQNNQMLNNVFDKKTLRCLHVLIEKYLQHLESDEDSKWKQTEWKLVGKILDKLFMYFFTSTLSLTIFACVIHVVQAK